MRSRAIGTIGRVHKRPVKRASEEICILDDSSNPIIVNMSLVRSITAHSTLFVNQIPMFVSFGMMGNTPISLWRAMRMQRGLSGMLTMDVGDTIMFEGRR